MPQLHFYNDPIPLEKTKHVNLKIDREPNFDYAEHVNSVPVAGMEFFKSSRHFPVVFVKNKDDSYIPIAMLSLRPSGHDYGNKWEDKYVPNYIRRYPFVLSNDGLVLVDSEAKQLSEDKGEALFLEGGEATDTLKEIVSYLEQLQVSYNITEEFTKALVEKDMLEPFSPSVKIGGATINLGELYIISEKKLVELNEKESYEWLRKGWIAWSYAHLHSLEAINILVRLLVKNGMPTEGMQAEPAAAANGAAANEAPAANETPANDENGKPSTD